MLVPECLDEQFAGLIVADHSNRENIDAEIGEIIDGVSTTTRNELALAMLENEDRSLSRDTLNVAKH